jgi:hypothetical protein
VQSGPLRRCCERIAEIWRLPAYPLRQSVYPGCNEGREDVGCGVSWLTRVAFWLLIVADAHAAFELWQLAFGHHAFDRIAAFWEGCGLVVVIDVTLLWLTIRVGRRLRSCIAKSVAPRL